MYFESLETTRTVSLFAILPLTFPPFHTLGLSNISPTTVANAIHCSKLAMAINVDWNTNIQPNEPLQEDKKQGETAGNYFFLSPFWPGPAAAPIVPSQLGSARLEQYQLRDRGCRQMQSVNANCKTILDTGSPRRVLYGPRRTIFPTYAPRLRQCTLLTESK